MARLVVDAVASAGRLNGALSPGQADAHGEFDGETLIVADEEAAADLVARHHNVRWADDEPAPEPDSNTGTQRVEIDGGGETTYRCGVNDCSRDVDAPDATCWQHEPDE